MKTYRTKAALATLALAGIAFAARAADRPDWDQKKAEQIVQAVLEQEKKGDFDWDKIAWNTDPEKVAALAKKQGKPIFVYLFVKKSIGPATAPC